MKKYIVVSFLLFIFFTSFSQRKQYLFDQKTINNKLYRVECTLTNPAVITVTEELGNRGIDISNYTLDGIGYTYGEFTPKTTNPVTKINSVRFLNSRDEILIGTNLGVYIVNMINHTTTLVINSNKNSVGYLNSYYKVVSVHGNEMKLQELRYIKNVDRNDWYEPSEEFVKEVKVLIK